VDERRGEGIGLEGMRGEGSKGEGSKGQNRGIHLFSTL
jgi:hypothetical protein